MRPESILLYSSLLIIFACSNIRNDNTTRDNKSADSIESLKDTKKDSKTENAEINQTIDGKVFFIKDSTKYPPSFIKELREIALMYPSLKLIDDKVIFEHQETVGGKDILRKDTAMIPSLLPLNVSVKYKSEKENNNYLLTLRRVGFTNIEYELRSNDKVIKTGEATLLCNFFIGVEFVNDENGNEYGIYEYLEKGECDTDIGVEVKTGERIDFKVSCIDSTKGIKYIPTMRKEK